jgi:hypothetical protein
MPFSLIAYRSGGGEIHCLNVQLWAVHKPSRDVNDVSYRRSHSNSCLLQRNLVRRLPFAGR